MGCCRVATQRDGRWSDATHDQEHQVRVKNLLRPCRPLRSVVLTYKECVDGVWSVRRVNFLEKMVAT